MLIVKRVLDDDIDLNYVQLQFGSHNRPSGKTLLDESKNASEKKTEKNYGAKKEYTHAQGKTSECAITTLFNISKSRQRAWAIVFASNRSKFRKIRTVQTILRGKFDRSNGLNQKWLRRNYTSRASVLLVRNDCLGIKWNQWLRCCTLVCIQRLEI